MNIPDELILNQIEMGPMANFVYIIGDKTSKEVAVVDLSWEVDKLFSITDREGYKIKALLLTHSHYDHIGGIEDFLLKHDVPVYISKEEAQNFKAQIKNIKFTQDKENIKIGNIDIECMLTPGHAPGSQCFRYKNVLLTGDTLFVDGCGRCDLPGGSAKQMYNSLYNIIMKLPGDTIVFPGHSYGLKPCDTLDELKKNNIYLKSKNENEFISELM